jgi:hypothetical protein
MLCCVALRCVVVVRKKLRRGCEEEVYDRFDRRLIMIV